MQYFISHQCTIIENTDSYTLFNWENGQEVHILKNLIHLVSDDRISFEQNFEKKNIEYLLLNRFIFASYSENVIKQRLIEIIDKQKENIKITLMPGGYGCNFRCKYCYESHDNIKGYGEKELNYFVKLIKSLKGKILIDFFGGEPLLNYKWIKALITNLNSLHDLPAIQYSMTTNGYLLDREKISYLVNSGVKTFQITVDGVEETHNKLRPLKNGGESWAKIIENLKIFKELDNFFKVIIRINYNSTSLDKEKLCKFLETLSFAKKDIRFKFIFRAIGDYSGINSSIQKHEENKDTSQQKNETFLKAFEFLNILLDNGFFAEDIDTLTRPAGLVCYASFPQNLVINGEGEILRCTVAVDQGYNKFGKVNYSDNNYSLQINDKQLAEWKNALKWESKCYKCRLLYQCLGMNCPVKNIANNCSACPPIANYADKILKLVLKQKQLVMNILGGRLKQKDHD